jgi:hypothetical protein
LDAGSILGQENLWAFQILVGIDMGGRMGQIFLALALLPGNFSQTLCEARSGARN